MLVGGVLLLVIALLAIVMFRIFAASIISSTHQDLEVIAQSKHAEIENFLHERRGDAVVVAQLEDVVQLLLDKNEGAGLTARVRNLDVVFNAMQTVYGYENIRLFDQNLATVSALDDVPLSDAESAALQLAMASRQQRLVEMQVAEDFSVSFGVAMPVFDGGSAAAALLGVVYLQSNPAQTLFPKIDASLRQRATGETLLMRRAGGDEIYFLRPPKMFWQHQIRPTVGADDHISKAALDAIVPTASRGVDYRGVEVLAVIVPVEGTQWFLVVKVDYAEIAAPIYYFGLSIIGIVTVLLVLLAVMASLGMRARRAEFVAQQAERNARYLAARQASLDGYLVFNSDGVILEANAVVADMAGYSQTELCGKSLVEFEPRLGPEGIKAALAEIRQTGGLRFQGQWTGKNGKDLDLELSVSYLPDAGGTFFAFLHDISQRLVANRRIQRLNSFYLFLSHVNAAIFKLQDTKEIFDAVCEGAVRDGGFVLTWAGVLDAEAGLILPTSVSGAATDYISGLVITTDPSLATSKGPTSLCIAEQRIIYIDDFQHDQRALAWRDLARQHNICSSAAVPIVVNGEAIAALCFYSNEKYYFDAELRRLLEEAGRNVSLALEADIANDARDLAQTGRVESEKRFRRALDMSPLPVQIHSVMSREMRFANKAHLRTFGYELEDMAHEADWFERVYPDPVERGRIRGFWEADIQRAIRTGPAKVIISPDLVLRCKDGSDRIVVGFMSVSGDDIIVQWEDFTEVKRAQAQLEENEQHFRSMIEQTLTGFCVVQEGIITYANPRLSNIVGWQQSELVGKTSLEVLAHSQLSKQLLRDAETQLAAGIPSVALQLPYVDKDGNHLVLGLHATSGVWNRSVATIVMLQDITERLHAENKIAAYVRQLEGTMQGTLRTVASMVEMRDPYTAGHERRVGVIAADIGREMGWSEERCSNLNLIGLVHDIGKIAVPAEILSKPGRLTPLEYQMVQIHAEKGYEILKNAEFPLPIAEIIREHHERMDGSGYPQGLKGNTILPEARVLAVADVLESMASHRPYRAALGIEEAIKEIQGHRGSHFDPEVVDAMTRMVNAPGYTLPA